MPILDGSVDKIIDEERKNITKYLKNPKKITVDYSNIPKWVRDIYKEEKEEII